LLDAPGVALPSSSPQPARSAPDAMINPATQDRRTWRKLVGLPDGGAPCAAGLVLPP
jgi:hypothetical protein